MIKKADIRPAKPVKYDTYGLNFSQADNGQTAALRAMEETYKNGGDWVSQANALQANGNFVSAPNEGGAPTGAYRSISGASNGSMLWGLDGKMANTGVEEGTQLIAPDGSYWQVGAGGTLNPYQAAVAAADGGGNDGGSYTGRTSYSRSGGGAGNPYQAAIDDIDYGSAPQWGGTEYERRRDEALQRAENMRFHYDPNTDPGWQAYQKQYRREGRRASADALGQAAAMTGGIPSSYAVTAASQAGDYYASQLSDRLPQLYRDAYDRYLQEYQRQLGIADAYAGYGQTEYDRYLDRLGQYNTDRNFAYGQYRDQVGDQRYADETAYARSRDAVGDERYDAEWAYRQGQDALADRWKETQWNQALREYDDQRHEAAVDEALAIAKYLGYVPEQYADILGVPAGTQYYTLANASGSGGSGGSRSAGGSGSTGDWSKLTAAKLRDALVDFYGGRILTRRQWYEAIGKDDRITDAWLRKNGFVQEQEIRNAESTNAPFQVMRGLQARIDAADAGQDAGKAAASPLRETAGGAMTHHSGTFPER